LFVAQRETGHAGTGRPGDAVAGIDTDWRQQQNR
jgi:hypothetical protein